MNEDNHICKESLRGKFYYSAPGGLPVCMCCKQPTDTCICFIEVDE